VSCSLAEAQALLAAGRIRSLGVMADARAPQFPSVPTFQELGADWTLGTIRGVAAPKDTPPDRVRVLAGALKRVVESDAYQNAMRRGGFTPSYEDPAQFAVTLAGTDARLGALLTSEAFRGLESTRFGPMFFPGLLMGALALVSGILLFNHRRRAPDAEAHEAAQLPPGAAWRAAEVLIWVALYLALAETLGFVLTAAILLLAYLLRLGTRALIAAPLTLALVPAVYHLFAVVLRVPLPRGLLGW
jgi:hypothetical protein